MAGLGLEVSAIVLTARFSLRWETLSWKTLGVAFLGSIVFASLRFVRSTLIGNRRPLVWGRNQLTVGRRARDALGWLGVVGLLPLGLVCRMRHSPALAERLIGWAVAWLPERYRAQYQAEWLAELGVLKGDDSPLLGWAARILATAPFIRVALRARLAGAAGRARVLPRSPVARTVGRCKPVWLGVLTAASVFCAAAVGWSGAGQHGPSRAQLVWAGLASVAAGGGVTWQTWPRGPAAEDRTSDEPERTTRP
jgi:hypothetical protein